MNEAVQKHIERVEQESGGEISLAARDLQTSATTEYHAERKVKTASVIKLPILIHIALSATEGTLDWNEKLTLTDTEKVGGSGILTGLTAGLRFSLRDLCHLMTALSDNTATNMIIERVGVASVNARMREFGLRETTLHRKAYSPDTPESAAYGMGVTTPSDMLQLLTLLHRSEIGTPEISAEIREFLAAQQIRDRIPRFLPPDWHYLGKPGSIDGVRNDVGIVTAPDGRAFALALFCQHLPDLRWTPDNAGLLALAACAQNLVQ